MNDICVTRFKWFRW